MQRTTLFSRETGQVTFQPNIGLDASVRRSVVDMLNLLLADEAVLLDKTHHNTRHDDEVDITEL